MTSSSRPLGPRERAREQGHPLTNQQSEYEKAEIVKLIFGWGIGGQEKRNLGKKSRS